VVETLRLLELVCTELVEWELTCCWTHWTLVRVQPSPASCRVVQP
jgi:hypothetical protein